MKKYRVILIREDYTLPPYIFYTYANDEAEAVLKVCTEHSDLTDVDSIECEEVEE